MRSLVEDLYRRYELPLCHVTENGACYNMEPVDDQVQDQPRLDYDAEHLSVVADLVSHGYCVKGYFAWSVMGQFRMGAGLSDALRLVDIDYETQKRIIKKSGEWYRELAMQFSKPKSEIDQGQEEEFSHARL
jgi:beta-glucosidase